MNGWNLLNILRVGKSANSFDLPTNCYYCTAAALRNMTCSELVKSSETMQQDTGDADAFKAIIGCAVEHKEYLTLTAVKADLTSNLAAYRAVAFGYNRVNGTGHMIVVFKAALSVTGSGDVAAPAGGQLRCIDYQKQDPQPADGLLPSGEAEGQMTRYHVFHLPA